MPPRRPPVPRACKLASQSKGNSAQNINLTNTGFAAQPRRRPKPRKSRSTPLTRSKGSAINPAPVKIQEEIGSSYRRWYPAIIPFLDYRPMVAVVQYSTFNPYRLNPSKTAILTEKKRALVEKQGKEIIDQVPASIDDRQVDRSFADGFGLDNLVSDPGQSVLDVAHRLSQEKKRNKDIENVLDFLHLSVIRVHQSMASPEEVCLYF